MAKAISPRGTGAKKALRTWIVVADGGNARILESGYSHSGVSVRLHVTSGARQTAGKLADDRLPRTQESKTTARHGIEPRFSLKDHEKRVFAVRLADYLKGGQDKFDQLVLVAPLRFLNVMKDALADSVAGKISWTRSKDLTWMTDAEVLNHLGLIGDQIRRVRKGA